MTRDDFYLFFGIFDGFVVYKFFFLYKRLFEDCIYRRNVFYRLIFRREHETLNREDMDSTLMMGIIYKQTLRTADKD